MHRKGARRALHGEAAPLDPGEWPEETEEEVECEPANPPTEENMDAGDEEESDDMAMMQTSLPDAAGRATEVQDARRLHEQLQRLPAGQATKAARQLYQRLRPHRESIRSWEEIEAVLVAVQEAEDTCESPEDSDMVDEWARHLCEGVTAQPASGSGDPCPTQPALMSRAGSHHAAQDETERRHEEDLAMQNERDLALFEWCERQREVEAAQQDAARAQREDRATLAAHMGWSTGPPTKRMRLAMTVQEVGKHAKHSEFDLDPGQKIQITMDAKQDESTAHFFHDGQIVNDQIARQLLLEEEERLRNGFDPEGRQVPPVVQKFSWPRLQTLFREGRISVADLYKVGGAPLAHVFAIAEEAERDKQALLAPIPTDTPWLPAHEPLMNVAYRAWYKENMNDVEIIHLFGPRVRQHFVANWNLKYADLEPPPETIEKPSDEDPVREERPVPDTEVQASSEDADLRTTMPWTPPDVEPRREGSHDRRRLSHGSPLSSDLND